MPRFFCPAPGRPLTSRQNDQVYRHRGLDRDDGGGQAFAASKQARDRSARFEVSPEKEQPWDARRFGKGGARPFVVRGSGRRREGTRDEKGDCGGWRACWRRRCCCWGCRRAHRRRRGRRPGRAPAALLGRAPSQTARSFLWRNDIRPYISTEFLKAAARWAIWSPRPELMISIIVSWNTSTAKYSRAAPPLKPSLCRRP